MKKNRLLALFLVLGLMLSLAACGNSSAPAASNQETGSTAAASGDAGDDTADNPYANPYANPEEGGDNPYANPYANPGEGGDNPYGNPYANPGEGGEAQEAPAVELFGAEKYVPTPGDGAKYTVTETPDGWIEIANEGGETLGLSPISGVKVVEADGFAFKDLNQNGELDPYEDWRLDSAERTKDLIAQMEGVEKATILLHSNNLADAYSTEPVTTQDVTYTVLMGGARGGVTRNGLRGKDHAVWANNAQAVAESAWYGIPVMISIAPSFISGMVESVSLASTMDPELAAEIGKETAREYRSIGVTAFLGPQVDIASPTQDRAGGTYGEDPQLTLDLATAYVNAMQSTYDESGKDLGWGEDSVYCFTKHFAGAGATEGGRNDHSPTGRYAVFPGDNLEAHLITYFDGVFNLPGKTGTSGIMTEYAIDVDGEGEPYGGEWAGAYNPYLNGMLDEFGFDGLKITDWGVFEFAGVWGAEDLPQAERVALGWERGVNLLGGFDDTQVIADAYALLVERNGQDKADEIIDKAASKFIEVMMDLNMFDQPYVDTAETAKLVGSDESAAYGLETQRESVVMIKNDGTISKDGAKADKPKVYVPYVYNTGFSVSWMGGINPGKGSWSPSMDIDALSKYFDVITDTVNDPTGDPDEEGNATYTPDDITRAAKEDIASCDYVLVGMTNPYSVSYDDNYVVAWIYQMSYDNGLFFEDTTWYPVSLQYGAYKADTARETSISGMILPDGTRQNRSYKGVTAPEAPNYGDLEALQYAADAAGDVPVIVSMSMERGMVWSEVEPLADVILVNYNNQKPDVVAEIILGKTEPNGLLVFQQPKDMEEVEKQLEDVPRDMECYKDSDGNVYDFAFGLNWSGKINDDRVKTYSKDPIDTVKGFDYKAYEAANK